MFYTLREFNAKLEEAEEDGTDPLSLWFTHLEWMEANRLTRHDCYKKALQQCTQYFALDNLAVYRGDMRLAMVYLKMVRAVNWCVCVCVYVCVD